MSARKPGEGRFSFLTSLHGGHMVIFGIMPTFYVPLGSEVEGSKGELKEPGMLENHLVLFQPRAPFPVSVHDGDSIERRAHLSGEFTGQSLEYDRPRGEVRLYGTFDTAWIPLKPAAFYALREGKIRRISLSDTSFVQAMLYLQLRGVRIDNIELDPEAVVHTSPSRAGDFFALQRPSHGTFVVIGDDDARQRPVLPWREARLAVGANSFSMDALEAAMETITYAHPRR